MSDSDHFEHEHLHPSRIRAVVRVLLLGTLLVCVDFVLAIRPWASLLLTVAEALGLAAWGTTIASLVKQERYLSPGNRVERGRTVRPYIVFGTLALAIAGALAGKLVVLDEAAGQTSLAPYAGSYRGYLVVAYVLFVVGLLGGPQRLGRLFGAIAEHHARLMVMSFGLTALLGALLLSLPGAVYDANDSNFVDALFTATSAVCVTGLTVNQVASTYTPFGQAVIFALFQVGGLGIMVLYTFFAVVAGRRLRVRHTAVMAEMLDVQSLSQLKRSLAKIVVFALCFELVGATILYFAFASYPDVSLGPEAHTPLSGAGSRAWAAAFHAVSAFCNAGFSNFQGGAAPFAESFGVSSTFMLLIVTGSIGYPVISELLSWFHLHARGKRAPRLSLHTRTVLWTNSLLLLVGAVAFTVLEWGNSMAQHPWYSRILTGMFQSVTTRTAGFSTLDFSVMHSATLLVTCGLMFIGASPGSTGGGIKTTTIAVLFAAFRAELRGHVRPHLLGRSIPDSTVRRALGVTFLSVVVISAVLITLTIVEPFAPLDIAFEVFSAMATVGLSTGITPGLSTTGKLLITLAMFAGRIGPLTLAVALAESSRRQGFSYPEERVGLG